MLEAHAIHWNHWSKMYPNRNLFHPANNQCHPLKVNCHQLSSTACYMWVYPWRKKLFLVIFFGSKLCVYVYLYTYTHIHINIHVHIHIYMYTCAWGIPYEAFPFKILQGGNMVLFETKNVPLNSIVYHNISHLIGHLRLHRPCSNTPKSYVEARTQWNRLVKPYTSILYAYT